MCGAEDAEVVLQTVRNEEGCMVDMHGPNSCFGALGAKS